MTRWLDYQKTRPVHSSALITRLVANDSSSRGPISEDALNSPGDFLHQTITHRWNLEVAIDRANHSTETAHVKKCGAQPYIADLIAVRFGQTSRRGLEHRNRKSP